MPIMSTNFAKTLVWKHEYDVKLWPNKERTPNRKWPPFATEWWNPPWIFSAYATSFMCSYVLCYCDACGSEDL